MKYTFKIILVILATMSWTANAKGMMRLMVDNVDEFEKVADDDDDDDDDEEEDSVEVSQNRTVDNDLPEGMQESELEMLYRDWAVRNYTNSGETCEPSTTNPEYTKEEYIDRLSRMQTVIEMPYNDIVRSFIDRYTNTMRRGVSVMLGAGNFYMPIFEEALESYQVPLELKYLPVIESAMNPGATSRVGAAGLWQFMIGTAKRYGMEVTSLVDERRDPIKASYAAAHYFKDLYSIFGDWTLCVAAYNCGPGNVSKAIKRAGGSKDFWVIYPYLPQETRGYVPAFIAANYVMNYYCDHNICPVETRLPAATDTIIISRKLHFDQIIQATGIDQEELKALNPQYRTSIIPGDAHPCTLKLPSEMVSKFIESSDTIYNYHADELFTNRREIIHEEGDDQAAVTSSRYSYSRHWSRSKRDRKRSRRSSGRSKTVTIKEGDTLIGIAARNHTTVEKLKRANGIKGDNIRAGKSLKIN